MSRENVELVRSICSAWERGDYSSAEWAHPDIEFVIADGPTPGRWQGLAGMAEGWRTWLGTWEDFRQDVQEVREVEDDVVIVLFRGYGRGKATGVDLAQLRHTSAGVFHLRDGKVTRFEVYFDRERALADHEG